MAELGEILWWLEKQGLLVHRKVETTYSGDYEPPCEDGCLACFLLKGTKPDLEREGGKMSELREKIADYLWQYRDNPPTHDLEALRRAHQILALIQEELEKVGKPQNPFSKSDYPDARRWYESFNRGAEAQRKLYEEHFKEE